VLLVPHTEHADVGHASTWSPMGALMVLER
jgi:hypothetical protein